VQSSNLVNSTIHSPIIYVISPHSSPTSSSGTSSSSLESYLVLSQPRTFRIYLDRVPKSSHGASTCQIPHPIPKFWGKGDEDVEQHWFLCEAIWWSHGTLDANKLVEFHTTLRGQALKWYMKSIEPGNPQGKPFPLPQVKQKFIVEFKLPQSEQQALSELWEIKQRDGESYLGV
jgi:hypothetical protein